MAAPGILLVDKPGGITSHDVVARARRALGTRKIGHAGTLDPMATGLLVLGVEGATRLLTFVVGLDKTYIAALVTIPVVLVVWILVRRIRQRLGHRAE